MKIRPAAPGDIHALVKLNREAQAMHAEAYPGRFRQDASPEAVAGAFGLMLASPASCWLVAEVQNQTVAFLSAEFRQREENWCQAAHRVCYLAGIVVDPGFRRQGIARALLDELKREGKQRGVPGIELDVWAFNSGARLAFAKLGFERIMERMSLVDDERGTAAGLE